MGYEVRIVESREKEIFQTLSNSVAAPNTAKILKIATFTLAGGNANAIAGYWQNPESVSIMVVSLVAKVTAAGGIGAGTLDLGTAADATTGSDNLIDGVDANAIAVYVNTVDGGGNGKGAQIMDAKDGATDYITCQILLQNEALLVGTVYVSYIPLS